MKTKCQWHIALCSADKILSLLLPTCFTFVRWQVTSIALEAVKHSLSHLIACNWEKPFIFCESVMTGELRDLVQIPVYAELKELFLRLGANRANGMVKSCLKHIAKKKSKGLGYVVANQSKNRNKISQGLCLPQTPRLASQRQLFPFPQSRE